MSELKIYQDSYVDATIISNRFSDEYMTDANDAQLKVYLYLVRMLGAHLQTGISDIADHFNHTEKDVIRALKYWEKKGILSLEYDENSALCGIHLLNLCRGDATVRPLCEDHAPAAPIAPATPVTPVASVIPATPTVKEPVSIVMPTPVLQPAPQAASGKQNATGETPSQETRRYKELTLDEARNYRKDPAVDQSLYVVEAYIGRPLNYTELSTFHYIRQDLGFSDDLIDHLVEYCVERGKKNFRYIEKVAINWHENGVTKPEEAKKVSARYEQEVYTIMNRLGKNNSPTDKEAEYIQRWRSEYGFTIDLILEACDRTVLATEQRRFQYAEGILNSWFKSGVHHMSDVAKLDENRPKKPAGGSGSGAPAAPSNNRFNQFQQNEIDFAELERHLFSN